MVREREIKETPALIKVLLKFLKFKVFFFITEKLYNIFKHLSTIKNPALSERGKIKKDLFLIFLSCRVMCMQ